MRDGVYRAERVAAMRSSSIALLVVAALSTTAVAEDKRSGTIAWGVAGLELGMAADFTLAFTTKVHSTSGGTLATALGVMAIGGGSARLAYKTDLGAAGPVIAEPARFRA